MVSVDWEDILESVASNSSSQIKHCRKFRNDQSK